MTDARPTKICPDCAETVLAAARKCRFCDYRFEEAEGGKGSAQPAGRPRPTAGPLDSMLSLLRRPDPQLGTEAELLASWGIVLDDDEGEAALCHGSIGGTVGFVAVTSTRFRFIPAKRRTPPLPVLEEHRLGDLIRVHRGRRLLRRVLFIEWRESRTVMQLDGAQLARLERLLEDHALAP